MDVYYILLGLAAVISALNGSRSTRALQEAIKELKNELTDHRARLTRLEEKVL